MFAPDCSYSLLLDDLSFSFRVSTSNLSDTLMMPVEVDSAPHRVTRGVFDLPPELRIEIYETVLQEVGPVIVMVNDPSLPRHLYSSPRWDQWRLEPPWDAANLLRASRAVYAEAAPILYSINQFYFMEPSTANFWLTALGPLAVHIRDISIHSFTQDSDNSRKLALGRSKTWLMAMESVLYLESLTVIEDTMSVPGLARFLLPPCTRVVQRQRE
ncbi:hypothetical protein Slin15195_G122620 [Septoria linicola]|uniref:Uncharacterized protein n=1 Tax=Septoria linicola TaxID=215465 RepID=A0A9Q9B4S6_9PEZI|nr:hypothetical protein Slin14017_G078820 [Septoria linicola]USW58943.1 hypothetical protein Slin15195_G122620 [Septoria linicola]